MLVYIYHSRNFVIAFAHSPIANLIPSSGAVLTDAPKEIQIEFIARQCLQSSK